MSPLASRWTKAEMGTLFVEILKSPSPYVWRNMHADQFFDPPNQFIWWEMYYRYREQMKAGFGLLEDFERRREERENEELEREDRLIADYRLIDKLKYYVRIFYHSKNAILNRKFFSKLPKF